MPRGRPRGTAPDKPRGRMTAYAFFVQTCRSEHKKLHPDESVQFAEFSRQCSERWKTMSEKEKKKFHDLADEDKTRYSLEMKDFVPTGGTGGRRGRRGRGTKPPKDPNKPKRALSAFFYYANDERANVRAANPDFSVGEVAKELGRQWTELTETEKHKYEKLAEADRARYGREMSVYKAGGGAAPDQAPFKKFKAANGHAVDAHHNDDDDDDDVGSEEDDEDDDSDD